MKIAAKQKPAPPVTPLESVALTLTPEEFITVWRTMGHAVGTPEDQPFTGETKHGIKPADGCRLWDGLDEWAISNGLRKAPA